MSHIPAKRYITEIDIVIDYIKFQFCLFLFALIFLSINIRIQFTYFYYCSTYEAYLYQKKLNNFKNLFL